MLAICDGGMTMRPVVSSTKEPGMPAWYVAKRSSARRMTVEGKGELRVIDLARVDQNTYG